MKTNMSRPVKYNRWGCENLVGTHVTLEHKGRTLIGEVRSMTRNEIRGGWDLEVVHMNGESWPFKPCFALLRVLLREYDCDLAN